MTGVVMLVVIARGHLFVEGSWTVGVPGSLMMSLQSHYT